MLPNACSHIKSDETPPAAAIAATQVGISTDHATTLDLKSFVLATGGGFGEYCPVDGEKDVLEEASKILRRGGSIHHLKVKGRKAGHRRFRFHQYQLVEHLASVNLPRRSWYSGVAFGRISFFDAAAPKLYLRVPDQSDPQMLIHFTKHVWSLNKPKLVIGVTGGASDFPLSTELEQVLDELMQIANRSDAWVVTGGTKAGIMKYCGKHLFRNP